MEWRKLKSAAFVTVESAKKVCAVSSFDEVIALAGLAPAPKGSFGPEPRWTKATSALAFQAFFALHGRAPTSREWSGGTDEHPSESRVEALHGSWNQGILDAGRPLNRVGRWAGSCPRSNSERGSRTRRNLVE